MMRIKKQLISHNILLTDIEENVCFSYYPSVFNKKLLSSNFYKDYFLYKVPLLTVNKICPQVIVDKNNAISYLIF